MKTIKFALAGALLAAGMASPVAVADPGKGNANSTVDFCKFINEVIPDVSVGECVGSIRADDSRALARTCRQIDEVYGVEAFFADFFGIPDITNRGKCLNLLKG